MKFIMILFIFYKNKKMRVITIRKNGNIMLSNLDGHATKYKEVASLKEYLSCEVEFEDGLKFETFFNLLLKEDSFMNILFKEDLQGKKLKEFLIQGNGKKKRKKTHSNALEVSKIFECWDYEEGSTVGIYTTFLGVDSMDENQNAYFSINTHSIDELANYRLEINKIIEIYKEDDEGMELPPFMAVVNITLYEAIQAIIYEISYRGDEEDAIRKEKGYIENKISILETRIKEFVDEDKFEDAAKAKLHLEKLKKVLKKEKK